jgi:hypothetical protein
MEDRRLTSIDVKVGGSGGSLLRKYVFDYTTTNRSFSGSDNMYYAGTMKLNSITQKDSDNNLALPAVSFTYDNLTTNYNNSPSFTWPHLTQVNSGYGGTISFAYTQIPSSPTTIWSREAVTTKTINNGIVTESPDYTYTDNPSYLGTDINQKFRGWNEVKETDDAANYTRHYFFTTGTIDGKDAEKLTGKEYKTQSYDSGDHLLKENLNNWNWESTTEGYVVRLYDVQENVQVQ